MIKTKVWAHRGASAYAPENSLEAFELAIKMGAHGIELDIYETADAKLVIHHDNDIRRMTNGVEAKIQETDFDTLRSYNFNGKWGDQYGFVKIPALHEVLDLFRPTDMTINIELKEGSVNYLKAINSAVKEFGMEEQIIYSSFDHIKLHRMKEIDPSVKTGALYSFNMLYPWTYARMAGVTALHPSYDQLYRHDELNMDYIKEAHAHGIEVNPWTANKEGIIRRIARSGADHIITDVPDVALRIIAELNAAENQ
jgi:glycerophosphoryl diester phosphodiesterase